MDDDEVAVLIERSRTCTMATIGPTGTPHGGDVVRRSTSALPETVQGAEGPEPPADPRMTVLIEDGLTYDVLRGVSLRAEIVGPRPAVEGRRQRLGALHGSYTEEAGRSFATC